MKKKKLVYDGKRVPDVTLSSGCMCVGCSYCDSTISRDVKGAAAAGGGGERGDSYCEIPMEGNWNSIGVRSWLLP